MLVVATSVVMAATSMVVVVAVMLSVAVVVMVVVKRCVYVHIRTYTLFWETRTSKNFQGSKGTEVLFFFRRVNYHLYRTSIGES